MDQQAIFSQTHRPTAGPSVVAPTMTSVLIECSPNLLGSFTVTTAFVHTPAISPCNDAGAMPEFVPCPTTDPVPCPGHSQKTEFTDNFELSKVLGEGTYGKVFEGTIIATGEPIAAKVSKESTYKNQCLENEMVVLQILNDPAFPRCIWFGPWMGHNVLVMDLLGKSLGQLQQECHGVFTLKTTLMLADQCLTRLEKLHSFNIVHGDVKPGNFLIGLGELRCNQVFLIDYGLARAYDKSQEHVWSLKNLGTPLYASLNVHAGYTLSPRDDLESLAYTFATFLRGSLPWKVDPTGDRFLSVYSAKKNCNAEQLFEGFPECFTVFLKYCRQLHYDQMPNYSYLRNLFQGEMNRLKLTYDAQFDWVLLKYM